MKSSVETDIDLLLKLFGIYKIEITEEDVIRIFGGKVVTEEESRIECRSLLPERSEQRRDGSPLVEQLREKGVMWWVLIKKKRIKNT
jgi:hypothetical protein